MINLSGRIDGSSRFAGDRQLGRFGSIGLGWELSKERFWKTSSLWSFAKLRASYGVTGNDGIGLTTYVDNFAPTAGLNMLQTSDVSSRPNITSTAGFEKIRKMELAVDLGFFKNRLLMTAAWYRHSSDHQLLPDALPDSGAEMHLREMPVSLENTGWEFTLTSTNIRTKDFSWTSSLNVSCPVSKLKAFPGLDQSPFAGLALGASPSSFMAYRYLGINPQTGVFSFQDINGDGVLDKDDRKAIASHDVRCFGGLENTFQMGNWELNFLLEARLQTGINPVAAFYAANPPGVMTNLYSNQLSVINDRWVKPGDIATYQKATTKRTTEAGRAVANYLASTGVFVDADFLRLKTFCLSYRWPKLFKVATGRVFIQGSNLLTLTPYRNGDPESQAILSVPPLRSIVLGAELRL
jgi:hypothetical protein